MKALLIKLKELKTTDVTIALMIIALPFLFYSYLLIPKVEIWETSWFTLNSYDFNNVFSLFWLINTKLLLIISLAIWFITCKHWWRNTIIIPIVIELYKLLSVISSRSYYVDTNEFLRSFPITIPVIILLYFISERLRYYSHKEKLKEEINSEIDCLINELYVTRKKDLDRINLLFKEMKKNKSVFTKEEYMLELITLRNKIFKK